MELDWHAQLAAKAASKLGYQSTILNVSAARRTITSLDLPSQQKGSLLALLTQSIWTMERAHAAGYDVPL